MQHDTRLKLYHECTWNLSLQYIAIVNKSIKFCNESYNFKKYA